MSNSIEIVTIKGTDGYPDFKVKYDPNEPMDCRKCSCSIYRARTYSGKEIPIEYDDGEFRCHFNSCRERMKLLN